MKRITSYRNYDGYIPGDAYFISDRTSKRFRRSQMVVEWTGLRVGPGEADPRPPQLTPPNVYPEGIPFMDARPPQDDPDRLQDDTTLQSVTGGFIVSPPGQLYPNGQQQQPGAFSPQMLVESPTPVGPNVLSDDITFITGKVGYDWVPGPTPPVPANARVIDAESDERVIADGPAAPLTGPVRVTR